MQAAVRAEEVRIRYAQTRLELEEKISKIDHSSELYKMATEDLGKLDEAMQKALEDIARKEGSEVLKVHREEYQKMVDEVRDGAGEIFDAIVSRGKGAFRTLQDWIEGVFLSRLKQLFQNLVASLFTGSFGLSNVLAGVIPSFGGSAVPAGSYGNVLGGVGSIGSIISTVGSGGIQIPQPPLPGMPEYSTGGLGSVLGGFSKSGLLGTLSQAAPLMGLFGGVQGLSGLFGGGAGGKIAGGTAGFLLGELGSNIFASASAGTGIMGGISGFAGALFSNPLTAIAAAGLIGIPALIKAFSGKTTYEAGSKEISRDFGGLKVTDDQYKSFMDSIGVSESKGWSYRAQMNRTPLMLKSLAETATQQGKLDEFLHSLEPGGGYKGKGLWGGTNARPAVETGLITGDWSGLDKLFTQLMETDKSFGALAKILPDWKDKVLLTKDLATANQGLFDSFKSLKDSIASTITPAETMFQKFLSTGEITKEFSDTILKFGGDLGKFEQISGLVKINKYFDELVQHFRETGEILPDLRRLIGEYGGDLSALDAAAGLPALKQQLGFIQGISGGLSGLAQQFDPARQLLSGGFGAGVQTALLQAGLDLDRFASLSRMIRTQQGWDRMSAQALSGGTISADMLEALSTYGGARGQKAVEMYGRGINTVTADLLGQTQINMEQAFRQALDENIGCLASASRDTTAAIDSLTALVEAQVGTASDNIAAALNGAKEGVVDVLNRILVAIYKAGGVTVEGLGEASAEQQKPASVWDVILRTAGKAAQDVADAAPSLDSGGEVLRSGWAVVHRGERFDGGRGFRDGGAPAVYIHNCYGYDDFIEKVRKAGISLHARGMPLTAPGY